MTAPLRYTLITSSKPDRLTKRFTLAAEGELIEESAGRVVEGRAIHAEASDLADLSRQLDALAGNEAPTWGLSTRPAAPIVTKRALPAHPGAIARDAEHFRFDDGPGVMMLDHDSAPPGTAGFTSDVLLVHLWAACPALAAAPMLIRQSATTGIEMKSGQVLKPPTRWRIYIPVTRAADIQAAGDRLIHRLWAVGYGWIEASKAGQALERTILDTAVWQAERMDFAAAPTLGPGLRRTTAPARLLGDPGVLFDLSEITIDSDVSARAAERRTAARHDAEPALQEARAAWIAQRAPEIAQQRGLTVEQAIGVLSRATDFNELPADFLLTMEDGQTVSVDHVLTHAAEFNGKRCADPLEPDYRGDRRIAVLTVESRAGGSIFSHAHGGRKYRLLLDAADVFKNAPSLPVAGLEPHASSAAPAVVAPLTFAAAAGGYIDAKLETVHEALQSQESGIRIGLDMFQDQIMIAGAVGKWRNFGDVDYGHLRAEFGRRGFKAISPEIMKTAVLMAADRNRFDSALEWANGLAWDGVPRIDAALPRYYRTDDSPYTRSVGAYLFTALAARALVPGTQVDMVPVFVGLQGEGKTSAVRALSPDVRFFSEINLKKIDDDSMARRIRGKLVGEIAELRGLVGRDQESVKAWITRREEVWRPLYREFDTTYPRRLVLIGTTNESEFLDDPTGERRWLPVVAGKVDVDALERDRDQLWAEGIARFRSGGVAWREAEALARAEHAKFKVADPWEEPITQWLRQPAVSGSKPRGHEPFRLNELFLEALHRPITSAQTPDAKRAAKILKNMGFAKTDRRIDGEVRKVWIRTAPPVPQ